MRSAWMIGLVFVLALAPTPVRAQDTESLRRELPTAERSVPTQ